jgi:hypothetical protein
MIIFYVRISGDVQPDVSYYQQTQEKGKKSVFGYNYFYKQGKNSIVYLQYTLKFI